jgi:hypothetical protein
MGDLIARCGHIILNVDQYTYGSQWALAKHDSQQDTRLDLSFDRCRRGIWEERANERNSLGIEYQYHAQHDR